MPIDKISLASSRGNSLAQSTSNLMVIKFNQVDNMLFSSLFSLQKKQDFKAINLFYIFSHIITMLQIIGGIVRVFEFPMTGSVGKIVFDFFA
ncbi:MAG: hypothetical protein EZS28_024915, partial [Streblomastix strix]